MKDEKIIQLDERIPKLKKQKQKQKAKIVNQRLILYVSVLFLLVLFVLYFRSPLSTIGDITVQGSHYMTKEEVIQLSGITYDTNFFRVDPEQIEEYLSKRQEVKGIIVDKKFPNHIFITIQEHKTVGYVGKEDKLYPLLENGALLSAMPTNTLPLPAPVLKNFDEGAMLELSAELSKLVPSVFRSISEIYLNPQPSDSLHLVVYTNEGYEVSATVRDFANKMAAYPLIIKTLQPEEKVRIHLDVGAYTERIE